MGKFHENHILFRIIRCKIKLYTNGLLINVLYIDTFSSSKVNLKLLHIKKKEIESNLAF